MSSDEAGPGRRSRRRGGSSRRSHRVLLGLAGLFVVLVGLGLLAIPLLGVPGDARAAKKDLTAAMDALGDGDVATARASVKSAREHVDDAQGSANGLGGDTWSLIPLIGTPVDDARHLVQALDDATAVAETGVDLYPSVAGKDATLFRDQKIDRKTLDRVIDGAHDANGHLSSAESELAEVSGATPFVGDTIAAQRDAAEAQVAPMAETLSGLEPMLDELPALFGFEGRTRYLVAMLNPAELRYSGGATLAFAPMTWDDGAVDLGESVNRGSYPRLQQDVGWRKVRGNPFHRSARGSINNATFAPSWSVSGEELLRGWKRGTGDGNDGLLAVDVVALSRLFAVTGDVEVPGYGTLTADNLVQTLVGSYDDYYPDPTSQDALNSALLPAFQEQLFSGGDFVEKARALGEAADGRHFALYFRDDEAQSGAEALGVDGDLQPPEGDYLGVFSQNTNGSKADYWQRRRVSLDVTLGADGAARDQLDVVVTNDSPPYAVPGPDPRTGYFTRWAGMSLGVFMPDGVTVDRASAPGESWDPKLRDFYEHDFISRSMLLEPSAEGRLKVRYDVPDAATVDESGGLTYRLAIDPQGMVDQQSVEVTVHLPDGYRATDLPAGWTADGDTVTYMVDDLAKSEEWAISLEESN